MAHDDALKAADPEYRTGANSQPTDTPAAQAARAAKIPVAQELEDLRFHKLRAEPAAAAERMLLESVRRIQRAARRRLTKVAKKEQCVEEVETDAGPSTDRVASNDDIKALAATPASELGLTQIRAEADEHLVAWQLLRLSPAEAAPAAPAGTTTASETGNQVSGSSPVTAAVGFQTRESGNDNTAALQHSAIEEEIGDDYNDDMVRSVAASNTASDSEATGEHDGGEGPVTPLLRTTPVPLPDELVASGDECVGRVSDGSATGT